MHHHPSGKSIVALRTQQIDCPLRTSVLPGWQCSPGNLAGWHPPSTEGKVLEACGSCTVMYKHNHNQVWIPACQQKLERDTAKSATRRKRIGSCQPEVPVRANAQSDTGIQATQLRCSENRLARFDRAVACHSGGGSLCENPFATNGRTSSNVSRILSRQQHGRCEGCLMRSRSGSVPDLVQHVSPGALTTQQVCTDCGSESVAGDKSALAYTAPLSIFAALP